MAKRHPKRSRKGYEGWRRRYVNHIRYMLRACCCGRLLLTDSHHVLRQGSSDLLNAETGFVRVYLPLSTELPCLNSHQAPPPKGQQATAVA
jgi:hypothetical protein